jgi:two-component sensor histidine kinase
LYIKPLNKLLVVKNKTKDTLELDLESYKVKDLQWARVKLLQLRDTSYLVASENKVLTYDKYGRFLQKVSLKKDSHTLFALHEDTEGNIWVGTRAGVYRFQKGNLNQVQKFLLHHTVSSVTQDTEGGYWFTTLHDGVFYQPNFEIKSTSSFQPQKTRAIDMAVSDAAVCVGYSNKDLEVFKAGSFSNRKIYKDHFTNSIPLYTRQGQVMVSNYGGRHYTIRDSITKAKKGGALFRMTNSDDRTGLLWKQGLWLIYTYQDKPTGTRPDTMKINKAKILVSAATASWDRSTIWLGSAHGLWVYKNGELSFLGEKHSGLNQRIKDVDLLDESYLLVTTQKGGVFRYNYQKNTNELLYHIPGNSYNHSLIDSQGTLWIASFSGIIRIDNPSMEFPEARVLSEASGLPSNEVYRIVEFKDQIWAATGAYVSRWNRDWAPCYKPVKTEIKETTVNGLVKNLMEEERLDHNENGLRFSFNTISFQKPISYHYRLKGLHSNWIHTSEREVSYSSLKSGNYTFELRHMYEENLQASIPFSIRPPWWLNRWLQVSIGIVILISVLLILRVRYRIILKENKLFELFTRAEQRALRAQVNPHFLFNAFSSITELMLSKKYAKANQYMERLTKLMRVVLRLSRKEEVLLYEELNFLTLYLEMEKLRFQFFDFNIEVDSDVDKSQLLIPSLLLQPYIENAIKHGIRSRVDKQGSLNIHFSMAENFLIIKMRDNGKGIARSMNNARKGSYGMKINGERIRLFQNKDKYSINIAPYEPENNDYPGTVVTLELPIKTKKHDDSNPKNPYS